MSTSTIKLYSGTTATPWKLLPNLLFKIDNIADYLAQFTPTTISNFQYVKNNLEVSIKLAKTQYEAQPTNSTGIKYVSITNKDENVAYYFVKRVSWRAQNTIQLDLVMDVLNTYTDGVHYNFKKNTRIVREHKSRFTLKKDDNHVLLDLSGINDDEPLYTDDRVLIYDYTTNDHLASGVVILSDYGREILELELTYEDGLFDAQLPINIRVKKDVEGEPPTQAFISALIGIKQYNEVFRNIDYINENINPLLHCGNGDGNLIQHEKSLLRQNWYLLYRNQNNPSPDDLTNPVECYLIPQNDTDTDAGYIQNGRLIPSFLEEGVLYVFRVGSGESATLSNGVTASYYSGWYSRLCITKAGNKINVMFCLGNDGTRDFYVAWQYDDIEYITFNSLPNPYNKYNIPKTIDIDLMLVQTWDYSFNNSGTLSKADSIDYLDKADPKNIKLIKLPYCPYDFSISTNKIELGTNWELASISQVGGGDMNVIRLKNLNNKLYTNFRTTYQPLHNLYVGDESGIDPTINDLRYPIESLPDSKLYHSEFYKPTYVYDSFTYAVQLEKIDTSTYDTESDVNTFYIKFDMTSTINSKFMFSFNSFDLINAESNFAKVMPIARNNEEVLYNVAYINYIKTGYNYDIKNKQITNASNYVGLGLSALSIGASLFAPSAPLKVAGIVGGFVSLAMSIKSTITSTIQNENTIQQRLNQTANQTSSVAGSDDVDLMSVYAENRLKYYVYQPTSFMRLLLNDLFFYAGYNSGRMGVPTHNNRVNFDYLECEAVIQSIGGNMSQEILDEIKNSFKVGVTFIHKTNRIIDKWDIEQKYENWENSLLED